MAAQEKQYGKDHVAIPRILKNVLWMDDPEITGLTGLKMIIYTLYMGLSLIPASI